MQACGLRQKAVDAYQALIALRTLYFYEALLELIGRRATVMGPLVRTASETTLSCRKGRAAYGGRDCETAGNDAEWVRLESAYGQTRQQGESTTNYNQPIGRPGDLMI